MRPYSPVLRLLIWYPALLLCSLVVVLDTPAVAAQTAPSSVPAQVSRYPAKTDPLTSSGFARYYHLDYDGALRDFEAVLVKHPDDPFAVNHVLETLLFRELYRAGILETGMFSTNAFLRKRKVNLAEPTKQRLEGLGKRSLELCEARIRANSKDADAHYARGVAKGIRSTYTALVERSWFAALRSAKGARKDHERTLEIEPNYADAKLVVGMHDYIVGSLPWAVRMLAHIMGESGDKKRGLQYLREAGEKGHEAAVDAKVLLGLFLRRERRFDEAMTVGHSLRQAHPRNFLFAIEEAHLLKDWDKDAEAASAYRRVLADAEQGKYFDAHLEFAYLGLGEALHSQRDYQGAAEAFDGVQKLPNPDRDVLLRANLAAGQMFDILQKREQALRKYQAVVEERADSEQATVARRLIKQPYREN
jgi:hypothetical protein